jgi:hypothetical protein
MSQDSLVRIEKTLAALAEEVAGLRESIELLRGGASPFTPRELCAFLDQYRAAESLGEAAFCAWAETCADPRLRGGLRVAQLREGSHARLLEARLVELGGTPRFEYPRGLFDVLASADTPDTEKLACFFAEVDPDTVLRQLAETADRMSRDPETQSLLRSIIEDERATLGFLQQARQQLAG